MALSEYAKHRFDLFLNAKPGWDSGEGGPAEQKTVDEATSVLLLADKEGFKDPSLIFGLGGEIGIIWHYAGGTISFDCFGTGEYLAFATNNDVSWYTAGHYPSSELPDWMQEVADRMSMLSDTITAT
jgi:hypothetical protein